VPIPNLLSEKDLEAGCAKVQAHGKEGGPANLDALRKSAFWASACIFAGA
jgi:hypothetical protein